eukprot:4145097-Pyramimonas_sp.AAC.1
MGVGRSWSQESDHRSGQRSKVSMSAWQRQHTGMAIEPGSSRDTHQQRLGAPRQTVLLRKARTKNLVCALRCQPRFPT